MGSSECREALVELAETLRDVPQCLILSHQHVRSVSGRLRRRGIALGSPTPRVLFFHDLRFESLLSGHQVLDSSELLIDDPAKARQVGIVDPACGHTQRP